MLKHGNFSLKIKNLPLIYLKKIRKIDQKSQKKSNQNLFEKIRKI